MMKNGLKKMVAAMLAVVMVMGLIACGGDDGEAGNNGTNPPSDGSTNQQESDRDTGNDDQQSDMQQSNDVGSNDDQSPIKFSVLLNGTNSQDGAEYEQMVKDINEYTNSDIEWVFDSSSDYNNQMVLRFIAQNLYSVNQISSLDANFIAACQSGAFWDLTDYIDDYPNLATIPEIVRMNASINGRLYGIPRWRDLSRDGLSYREDWLENLNLEAPTTLEAFYEMLYQFTYNDPDGNGRDDTYGMLVTEYQGPWNIMQIWFGVPNGWGIDEDGDLIPAHLTEEYKTALAFFRKMYDEGLVNKDFNETSSNDWDALFRGGQYGSTVDILARARRAQDYCDQNGIPATYNMFYAVDTGLGYLCNPTDGFGGVLAISTKMVKTEDELRRVLSALDAMNDGVMSNLIDMGYEGIHYFVTDDGYYQYYTDEEKTALGVTLANYRNGFNQVLASFRTPEQEALKLKPAPYEGIRGVEEAYMDESEQYVVTNYARSYLNSSPTYMASGTQLDQMISDARIQYITGEIDEVGLDAVLNQWLEAGGQDIIDELNEMYHANN